MSLFLRVSASLIIDGGPIFSKFEEFVELKTCLMSNVARIALVSGCGDCNWIIDRSNLVNDNEFRVR